MRATPLSTPIRHVLYVNTKMSAVSEPEVEELVLPGLVGKKDEQPGGGKEKADKVTGQRLKLINTGDDSDEDLETEEEEDVSEMFDFLLIYLIRF